MIRHIDCDDHMTNNVGVPVQTAIQVPEHIAKCSSVEKFGQFLIDESVLLDLILKGHHAVECNLNAALVEVLQDSDALELSRLTFLLKVDLCIAMGLIVKRVRPLFNRLNTYRNRFAHNPHTQIEEAYSTETLGIMNSIQSDAMEIFCEPYSRKDLVQERRLVLSCYRIGMFALREAMKKKIAEEVNACAMVSALDLEDIDLSSVEHARKQVHDHFMQVEAEIFKERYPYFFSYWPT